MSDIEFELNKKIKELEARVKELERELDKRTAELVGRDAMYGASMQELKENAEEAEARAEAAEKVIVAMRKDFAKEEKAERDLKAELAEANMNASGWRDQCSRLETILMEHHIDYDAELEASRSRGKK